jgi:hypothetical protein
MNCQRHERRLENAPASDRDATVVFRPSAFRAVNALEGDALYPTTPLRDIYISLAPESSSGAEKLHGDLRERRLGNQ